MLRRKKRKPKVSRRAFKSAKALKEMGFHIPIATHQKKNHPVLRPFIWIERRLENVLGWLQRLALLEILAIISNVGILFAIVAYAATEKQRRDEVVFTAWQTITNAEGQSGSGGRIKALEFLNASPGANWRRRAICLWLCTWPAESLDGINLGVEPLENLPSGNPLDDPEEEAATEPQTPGVYLRGIQLPNARLASANLQDANLRFANLQDAILWNANLQDANLRFVNLQDANLEQANLQDADLGQANLQDANLEQANLQDADLGYANLQDTFLRNANLQDANLRFVNLQGAILLATDLRSTLELRSQQLTGETSPSLCNVALPDALNDIDPNRDCEILPQLIMERYSLLPGMGQQLVHGAMEKQWD